MDQGSALPARRIVVIVPAQSEDAAHIASFLRTIVTLARNWELPFEVLAAGPGAEAAAVYAVELGALAVTLIADFDQAPTLQSHQLVTAFADTLAAPKPDLIIFPTGQVAEECAARLAFRIGGTTLGRCDAIQISADGLRARRSGFGGRVHVDLEVAQLRTVVVIVAPDPRATAAPAADALRTLLVIRRMDQPLPAAFAVEITACGTTQPQFDGAKVIVSGGRGIGGPEGFAVLARLAHRLGAALGGSLPAVDAGWIPVSGQIGQSGKHVAPDLYVAVGISGTAQHLAGLDPRTRIIAINTDPGAEIFRVAEIGAVADWEVLVPALIECLAGVPTA